MQVSRKLKISKINFLNLVELSILLCSGYMAPEYARHGQFSTKSDVFSFGILVLEIVSGTKNSYIRDGENTEYLSSFVSHNCHAIISFML